MFTAIAIAANGLATQSKRIETAAHQIASMGAPSPAGEATGAPGSPVRIGALPVGDPVQSVVTLIEAKMAYRMNAAVVAVAADMIDTLLDAYQPRPPDERRK